MTYKLPAIRVKNHVVWKNPNFDPPFILEKGAESPLGLMLALSKEEIEKPDFFLGVRRGHCRTSDIGRITIADRSGRHYHEIDLKGSGCLTGESHIRSNDEFPNAIEWQSKWEKTTMLDHVLTKKTLGLLDLSRALHDAEHAERVMCAGIPTDRILAVIALDELTGTHDHEISRFSIEQWKKLWRLNPDFYPAIAVRAFTVKARIADVITGRNTEQHRALIIKAKHQTQEGHPGCMCGYLEWMVRSVGTHLGRLHKSGYSHGWMHPQNIALDASLIDCGSGVSINEINRLQLESDIMGNPWSPGALMSLNWLQHRLIQLFPCDARRLRSIDVRNFFLENHQTALGHMIDIPQRWLREKLPDPCSDWTATA
ncbi:MAG: hypothetical protein HYS44_01610 [Candidatus Niyogibacteria bacterium]|nr:hypothetical protein [Candidatus Niyogibacteria bacterium]